MSVITPAVCGVFAACFALGAAVHQRNWETVGGNREQARLWVLGLGWALLALSARGFILPLGWEVGLAWFLLWSGLAAVVATVWISVGPRSLRWAGPLLIVAIVIVALIARPEAP